MLKQTSKNFKDSTVLI